MKTSILLAFAIGFLPCGIVFSADIIPSVPIPEIESERGSETSPGKGFDPGAPPIPPSSIDPGIERRPPTIPDRRSAVPPPNVDPKMTINPETAPPTEGLKPQGGTK